MYMIFDMLRDRRVQFVIAIVVLMAVSIAGWYAYKMYRASINEQAQQAFSVQLDQFEQATQNPKSDWDSVAQGFSRAYRAHARADIAPFFKVFESEALWQAHKQAEAFDALKSAVNVMSTSSPFFYLYKTKLAIMELHVNPEQGKKSLQELADDIHNPHRGWALYELWMNALVANDQERASNLYIKLMSYQQQGAQWGLIAQSQLACNG